MKVLWFVNVPFPPIDQLLPSGRAFAGSGWWMASLLEGIRKVGGIDIHVAWGHSGAYHATARLERSTTIEAFPLWRRSSPERPGNIGRGYLDAAHLFAARYPIGVDGVIERVAPQVIHVHGTEGPYGLLLQRWRLPTVISIQGSPKMCAARYWGSQGLAARARHPRGVLEQLLLAVRGRREAEILRGATAVAGRTRWDERFCRTKATRATYHRSFESVRPEFLSTPRADRTADREHEVVVVSSAQPYKGIEHAIAAVARLRSLGRRVRLVLVGGYPARGWGAEIRRAASAAGFGAVEMTGYLSAPAIASRLAQADAFVLPSYVENSSNSLLEAMAAGAPCVAARVGGVPSMMRDQRDGLLFRRGDVVDLASKLDQLLSDRVLAARLGQAGAERSRATCRSEDVARSTISMYERVAAAAISSPVAEGFA